jgi:hypothetical protein
MITVTASGDFKKTQRFLDKMAKGDFFALLDRYGAIGVSALASATPVDTGLTANSWTYVVEKKRGKYSIVWNNTNMIDNTHVVILIEYGHGTGTGGFVQGREFINEAIKPLFDQIANEVWEQVKNG